MGLASRTRLGAYEILAQIGSGGMGEVYRAKDTKLGRDVALKILPDTFTHDPDRVARFGREAHVLASLNHPHIGAIYGLDEVNGQTFLVLELIDGETLAHRIAKGPLAVDDALPIARQIAEALEAAHERGIVHRDLKPANIALTKDGHVKVLDFGLAKATDTASGASVDLTHSPTLTSPAMMTGAGVILGTAAYMSPEQAKGRPADQRSDVWAYGCVLYEMLTGRRAFDGQDATDVIAAIVRAEPDWTALPANTPEAIRRLLRRCLEKDRERRLANAADARLEIDDARAAPAAETLASVPIRRVGPFAIVALVTGALIATPVTWAVTRPALPSPVLPSRFAIVPPLAKPLGNPGVERDFVVSPDGRYIAYRSSPGRGGGQLAVRSIDQLEPWTLEGITNAREPFFSVDSHSIGFFDGDELKKVSLAGGPPVTICEVKGAAAGASWGDDNTIVFATNDVSTGLQRVSAMGRKPTSLTTLDATQHERSHIYPWMLPGGRGVLFTITTDQLENAQVAVLDFRTGQRKTLIHGGTDAKVVEVSTASPGPRWAGRATQPYLLYASSGTLRAVRIDLDKLELIGDPVAVVDDVLIHGPGAAEYAVSRSGTLVYAPGASDPQRATRSLLWVDREGREEPIKAPARAYGTPRLSPDGSRILVDIDERLTDIWTWDLTRETLTRVTSGGALYPIWTHDGRRIVFSSLRGRATTQNLFMQNADGAGAEARLTASDVSQVSTSVTPDGKYVVGWEFGRKTQRDITLIPLANAAHALAAGAPADSSPAQVQAIVQTPFNELSGDLSPDGRYLAYQSDESGRYEIYVRPFPEVNAGRWQISTKGGTMPAWAHSGQELFYLDDEGLLTVVPTRMSGSAFTPGRPARILETRYAIPRGNIRAYDVSPDGHRFLMQKESGGDPRVTQARMVVVLNWIEELRARVSLK